MTRKEKLALSVFERAKELGLPMKVEEGWVVIGGNCPTGLLINSVECPNELAKLVEADQ